MTNLFACGRCGAQNIPYGMTPCPHCAAPLAYAAPAAVPMSATAPMAPYVVPASSMSAVAPLPVAATSLSGIGRRFVAGVIDAVVVGVPTSLLFGTTATNSTSSSWNFDWNIDLPTLVVAGIYTVLMTASPWQATLGMKALSMRVIGEHDGARISHLTATGRYFASILSAALLFIGYLMIAFTPKRQALHDKLANTLVVTD
ncbi:MAG: hypothetical protein JWN72_1531 [Thermoleophilia bacterium]|nr:hypothetical protein [Thermoleophilia bacterium]